MTPSRTAGIATLAIASLLMVTACGSEDPGSSAAAPVADGADAIPADQSPPLAAMPGRKLPEIDGGAREPVNIDGARTLTQRFLSPPASEISQIGVMVGTYGGESDGHLVLELCQAARCAIGETALSTVADNTFAMTQLDSPFQMMGDQALSISISTRDASRAVAVWAYDVPAAVETSAESDDGTGTAVSLENTSFLFQYL